MKTIFIVSAILLHLLALGAATPIPFPLTTSSPTEAQTVDPADETFSSSANGNLVKRSQQQRDLASHPYWKEFKSNALPIDLHLIDISERALLAAQGEQQASNNRATAVEADHILGDPPELPDPPCCSFTSAPKDTGISPVKSTLWGRLTKRVPMPMPFGFDWYELGAHDQNGHIKKVVHLGNGPASQPPAAPKLLSKNRGAGRGWRGWRRPSPHRSPDTS